MDNNREIGVIITNREAIDYFMERFSKDRAKAKTTKTYKVPVKKVVEAE